MPSFLPRRRKTRDEAIAEARGVALQIVSALIHDDQAEAVRILHSHPDPTLLAYCLAGLSCFVHEWWALETGESSVPTWQDVAKLIAQMEEEGHPLQ